MSIIQNTAQQQSAFAAAVLARDVSAAPLQALFVGAPDHITRRLNVYRANLQAARLSALQVAFPTVQQIVGDEFFAGLAREYGRAHPSANGNLNHFGAAFAEFLQSFAPAAELPYLSDVAQLDWAMHCADGAEDAPALDARALSQALGTHAAVDVRLQLHPAVQVLASAYPLYDIWLYNQNVNQHAKRGDTEVTTTREALQGQCVIVHRPQWRATVTQITKAQATALQALQHGQSLQAALAAALAIAPEIDLAQALANWCAMDILVRVIHN
jgi:uncharacterized protein